MPAEVPLGLGSNLSLHTEDTEPVNQATPIIYLWACLPLLVTNLVANTTAALVFRGKEGGLARLIMWDCLLNMVTMWLQAVRQTPWFLHFSALFCSTYGLVTMAVVTWNRLVPVAIVAGRYLLVCQAVLVHNHGGERMVWRAVTVVLVVLSVASGVVTATNSTLSLSILRCRAREEEFRQATTNTLYFAYYVLLKSQGAIIWLPYAA